MSKGLVVWVVLLGLFTQIAMVNALSTGGNFTIPVEGQDVTNNINMTWTAPTPFNATTYINYYNISLYNYTGSYVQTLTSNSTTGVLDTSIKTYGGVGYSKRRSTDVNGMILKSYELCADGGVGTEATVIHEYTYYDGTKGNSSATPISNNLLDTLYTFTNPNASKRVTNIATLVTTTGTYTASIANISVLRQSPDNSTFFYFDIATMVQDIGQYLIKATTYDNYNQNNTFNVTVNITGGAKRLTTNFLNEVNANTIAGNINVEFASPSYVKTTTVTSGTITLLLQPENYSINYDATGYDARTYNIQFTNASDLTLNLYLLNTTNGDDIAIYIRDSVNQLIPGAMLTFERPINNQYYTVLVAETDVNGYALVNLQTDQVYKVTLYKEGYILTQFDMRFYTANSPYTFKLAPTTVSTFTSSENFVNYSYNPRNGILPNNASSTFSFNTFSSDGLLEYVYIKTPDNLTNVSGTPTGLIPTYTVDLSNNASDVYPVSFCYKASGFTTRCLLVNYYVNGQPDALYNVTGTLTGLAQDLRGSDGNGPNSGWGIIIAVFATLVACITINQLFANPAAVTFTGMASLVFFGFLGFMPMFLVTITAITVIVVFVYDRYGG